MTVQQFGDYQIDSARERVDFARVTAWLASSYWAPGISRQAVERSAHYSSLVVGAYAPDGQQAGFLRVVSDRTTFAWFSDVWVDQAHRRRGLAQAMVRYAMADPEHQGLRRWMLITHDAQPLYRQCGFEIDPHPGRVMTHRPAIVPAQLANAIDV